MSVPAWIADEGGPDRQELYKSLVKEPTGWTPRQIANDMSVPQLWALFMGGDKPAEIPAEQPQTPQSILEWANKRRAAKGLPPAKMV